MGNRLRILALMAALPLGAAADVLACGDKLLGRERARSHHSLCPRVDTPVHRPERA